jgi:hypothetical protein
VCAKLCKQNQAANAASVCSGVGGSIIPDDRITTIFPLLKKPQPPIV